MVATDEAIPARIRNTAVGVESYASLSSGDDATLSRNVQTCAADPCSALAPPSSSLESAGGKTSAEDVVQSPSSSGGVFEGGEGDFTDLACVDGNLGVYCPCFQATVTGAQVGGGGGGQVLPGLVWFGLVWFWVVFGLVGARLSWGWDRVGVGLGWFRLIWVCLR